MSVTCILPSAEAADPFDDEAEPAHQTHRRAALPALTLSAAGVVYGDIGTSPLYAFREALRPAARDGVAEAEVLGVLSLLIWSLLIVVTVKYVILLLKADNRGEGGVLALYGLNRLALGRRSLPMIALAVAGAALFLGDAAITPAISVLSAVEGLTVAAPGLHALVLPVTVGIIGGLFLVQVRGTGVIAVLFGPVMALWFVVLGGLGLAHIADAPQVLASVDLRYGAAFLIDHTGVSLLVLGGVFLAVTGGEALYADLGHFGRKPIRIAWFGLVLPGLVLNYLGQGALVLDHPETIEAPFFNLVPAGVLPWLIGLATAATIIAAQAVISGAFSMVHAAILLGLLPRMTIRYTSEQRGQIYLPAVNWMLLGGVLAFVIGFGSSEGLAAAYGIAVTGAMLVDTALAAVFFRLGWRWKPWTIAAVIVPLALIEGGFLAANLSKFTEGGYVPFLVAAGLTTIMGVWWTGSQRLLAQDHRERLSLDAFLPQIERSSAHRIPGTAVFLTPDPESVPSALLHNLKQNHVLHEQIVILNVETLRVPYTDASEAVVYTPLSDRVARLTLRFGFRQTPHVSRALVEARRQGFRFDVMRTTFFLGRRKLVLGSHGRVGLAAARLFLALNRLAADPSDFYHLPRNRVVELGTQISY